MPLYVALMRSVVVGGHRVKMADARAFVEGAGGEDVRSVIATGNLLFRSRKSARRLEAELERACAAFYGKPTEMVVKSAAQWRAMLAANPFADEARRGPERLLVWAMRDPMPDSGLAQLRRRARGDERIERTADGDVYMWFGDGDIHASKLPAGFGLMALGAVGTNRNWNTCRKIAAALEAMDGRN